MTKSKRKKRLGPGGLAGETVRQTRAEFLEDMANDEFYETGDPDPFDPRGQLNTLGLHLEIAREHVAELPESSKADRKEEFLRALCTWHRRADGIRGLQEIIADWLEECVYLIGQGIEEGKTIDKASKNVSR